VLLRLVADARQVTLGDVATLLFCYLAFISVVLAADIYHRTVVLPRERLLAASTSGGAPANSEASGEPSGFELTESGPMALAISALQEMQVEMDSNERVSPSPATNSRNGPARLAPNGRPASRVQRDIEGVTNHRAQ
jgi:hypothetical protein